MEYFITSLSPDNGGVHDTTKALALMIETLTSRTGLGAGQTNRQTDRHKEPYQIIHAYQLINKKNASWSM